MINIDAMVQGYLTCALWTENVQYLEGVEPGEESDRNYLDEGWSEIDGLENFSPESRDAIRRTCERFLRLVPEADQEVYVDEFSNGFPMWRRVRASARMGHDLWLTQNHHGTGFWDRGDNPVYQRLTDVAHRFGEGRMVFADTEEVLHMVPLDDPEGVRA